MAEIVQSLFGVTPESYQMAQQQRADAQALQFAKLDPFEQANFAIGRGAYGLAGAIGGALGGQDPELQRISMRQQIARQLNPNEPASIEQAIAALSQAGDPQGAMMLQAEYRKLVESNALVGQRGAAATASQAQAQKTQLSVEQDAALRAELAKLGPNATEADIRGVVVKYGDPDKVLAALQTSADREAKRQTDIQLAREKIQAKEEADLRQAKNDLERDRIRAESRLELAQLVASLKGPSPAVLKAQEKAAQVAEGKETLGDILSTAQTLVKDLKDTGGMSSTSAGALSNLITSAQTGTSGQFLGGVFGTEAQSKRDQLKSVRLQLLNAIKQATGMSAQQLNSNVELQTYLKSLGSEGMTAEANLAIIDNLSKTYLGKGMAPPDKPKPGATPSSGLSAAEQAELDQLRSRFGRSPR
jgi:hypothetical protein